MKHIPFGSTGVQVSEFCLGTMMFGQRTDEAESHRIMDAALDAGVNFFDTAPAYTEGACEKIIGRGLKDKRNQVFLATKTKLDTGKPLAENLEASLARLATDHVDLYIIHWPGAGMDTSAMMEALDSIVRSGKARFVGASNFPAWLLAHCNALAERNGWTKLVSNQVPYNLIERGVETEILPQAMGENLAITPYRALAMGILSGKYRPGDRIPPESRVGENRDRALWLERFEGGLRVFLDLAQARNLDPAALAIAWVRASQAVTSPLVGISRADQLASSLAGFSYDLSPEDYETLGEAFTPDRPEEAGGRFPELRKTLNLIQR